jgi:hypothetical protein
LSPCGAVAAVVVIPRSIVQNIGNRFFPSKISKLSSRLNLVNNFTDQFLLWQFCGVTQLRSVAQCFVIFLLRAVGTIAKNNNTYIK